MPSKQLREENARLEEENARLRIEIWKLEVVIERYDAMHLASLQESRDGE